MPSIRHIHAAWYIRWGLFILPSLLLLYLALFATVIIRYPDGLTPSEWQTHLYSFSIIFGAWAVVLFMHGLFDFAALRRYNTLFVNLVSAMSINVILAVIFFYFQPGLILTPRRFLLIAVALSFVFLLLWQLFIKFIFGRYAREHVYLCAVGDELSPLLAEIERHTFLGFSVAGIITPSLVHAMVPHKNATIILSDSFASEVESIRSLYRLRTAGVRFYDHRMFYELLMRKVYIEQLHEGWFLQNIDYSRKELFDWIKRFIDILAGIILGAVFLVTLPIVSLLVVLFVGRPIFFTQARVGKNGKTFVIYKYKTMAGSVSNTWTAPSDPRVTPFGKFLRITKLDELPQCINVLRGNMSLVGPRPEQVHIVEQLREEIPFFEERHLVKPGLTGWAQLHVYAGSIAETKEKLAYDLYYIKHRSILLDIEIILKTARAIFTGKGR